MNYIIKCKSGVSTSNLPNEIKDHIVYSSRTKLEIDNDFYNDNISNLGTNKDIYVDIVLLMTNNNDFCNLHTLIITKSNGKNNFTFGTVRAAYIKNGQLIDDNSVMARINVKSSGSKLKVN